MKQVISIIRPFRAEKVLKALVAAGFQDMVVRDVKGYGRQKSYLSKYEENEYSVAFLPKIEICIWTNDDRAEEAQRIIVENSRTGRMGDGKIFSLSVSEVD